MAFQAIMRQWRTSDANALALDQTPREQHWFALPLIIANIVGTRKLIARTLAPHAAVGPTVWIDTRNTPLACSSWVDGSCINMCAANIAHSLSLGEMHAFSSRTANVSRGDFAVIRAHSAFCSERVATCGQSRVAQSAFVVWVLGPWRDAVSADHAANDHVMGAMSRSIASVMSA